jgi:cellulose synthase/poly-beta-1,6-N-acetylglucosamine synthase-like glycosyltransferase
MTAARTSLLPLNVEDGLALVLAPRSVREFVDYAARHPNVRFRLTSAARLNAFIAGCCGVALGHQATHALARSRPQLSAGLRNRSLPIALAMVVALIISAIVAFPTRAFDVLGIAFTIVFLCWLALRLWGSCLKQPLPHALHIPDCDLPIYTIIVALYREAEAVDDLISALRQFDYPREKLDIKIAIEADDVDTRMALARHRLGAPFEIVIVPAYGPRTKPKALNAALAFARGTFTVVYDAEDRPEPNQLRRALDAFRAEGDAVACVQAALTIDNTDDNWLSALFTAEYAAQFDLFLPGLSRLRLPLPLGGSSNHFRTTVLRELGAWDPYNVTEDADLGMRLARFGYRSAVIQSTTFEEAPARAGSWLKQRTRWLKGWMQTWAVHMRTPLRLWRELGPAGFLAFQLVIAGNVVAALLHTFFLGGFIYAAVGRQFSPGAEASVGPLVFYWFAFLAGYVVSIALGLFGLARRGLLRSAWALTLVVLHWLLLSVAAWRALFHLACDPYGWEKTAHGLGKSSRRARIKSAATLAAVLTREPRLAPAPLSQPAASGGGGGEPPQAGARTTASKVARRGSSSVVSRSSRAIMPTVTLGNSGRTPGASMTSGGGRMRRGIER